MSWICSKSNFLLSISGHLKAVTGGFKDVYSGRGGCIRSSSMKCWRSTPRTSLHNPIIVKPQLKKQPPTSDWSSSSDSSGSPPSSEEPDSPQHRSKFPFMGIGQILKKKLPPFSFQLPPFKPEPAVEVESPTPYHMQTLLCASGALKTLCWGWELFDYIKSHVFHTIFSHQHCLQ